MSELRELYQEMILEHGRQPRNCHVLPDANRQAEGFNRVCGDRLTLYAKVDQNQCLTEISFTGSGCAIAMASASLLTETLKGKTEQAAIALFHWFHALLTQENASTPVAISHVVTKKLMVFSGVKAYPVRVKCATLAWHTLHAALQQTQQLVSTER